VGGKSQILPLEDDRGNIVGEYMTKEEKASFQLRHAQVNWQRNYCQGNSACYKPLRGLTNVGQSFLPLKVQNGQEIHMKHL
jgi:hypothetical protein